MRLRSVFFVLISFMVLFNPVNTYAEDYISDATQALQESSVYVAPGTEGTDRNTAGKLQRFLRDGDNIVLVMLPSDALEGKDLDALVIGLSAALDDEHIIGLAVGREVIGYGPMLPVGIADDQMRRADSVSNDPITALSTFAQNMHFWQERNPQPTQTPTPAPTSTPKPISPQKSNSTSILFLVFGIVAAAVGFILVFVWMRRWRGDPRVSGDLSAAEDALDLIKQYLTDVPSHSGHYGILHRIYRIANEEIVQEIKDEPHRATSATVFTIRRDLEEFAEVLRFYTGILSGHLSTTTVGEDIKDDLEEKFFPQVEKAFRQIADELDSGDLQELENLVRSLSNEFKTRGIN